jgi:Replication-relaxation
MRGNRTKRAFVAQPRDLHLLRELAVMRILDREQAQLAAGFRSITRANTRIPKLVQEGLATRFYIASEKGGKKSLYSLTPKGAALALVPVTGIQRKKNQVLVGDLFIAHQLKINDVYLSLKYRPIPIAGVRLLGWKTFSAPLSSAARIIPDAYFELTVPDKSVCCFLEVDLGGETAKIWRAKIEYYLRLAVTGEFEQLFQRSQFRVLIITTSAARIHSLRKLAAKYIDKLFWVSTFDSIKRDGFWSPVWFRPTGDQPQSLL